MVRGVLRRLSSDSPNKGLALPLRPLGSGILSSGLNLRLRSTGPDRSSVTLLHRGPQLCRKKEEYVNCFRIFP